MRTFLKIAASFVGGVFAALVIIWFVNRDMSTDIIEESNYNIEQTDSVKVDTVNVVVKECEDDYGC